MEWEKLLSPARFGKENIEITDIHQMRSEFQRDYDRLIFSSPFRRLQNKTQVFPLPGSVFVHNRLTHSLEVASVGRSLGSIIGRRLQQKVSISHPELFDEIGSIVATASLSHDLGNPPFGHSGEEAISAWFSKGDGKNLKEQLSLTEWEWADLTNFEGNANALRLLTHQFNGRRKGGYVLTYATLASLIKYPYGSLNRLKKNKFGYFKTEEEAFINIARHIGLKAINSELGQFARHPLVYLVEAADDISYQIMDIEDAHKLGILGTEETVSLLLGFFDPKQDGGFYCKKEQIFNEVSDKNEQIAFLRASVINRLVMLCADIFLQHHDNILEGQFSGSLVDYLPETQAKAMKVCSQTALSRIYRHRSVIEIEITGYNVLQTLLSEFVQAILNPNDKYSEKLLALLPLQYREVNQDNYLKLRSVIDFISGMTDLYAMDIYKLIRGIGIHS